MVSFSETAVANNLLELVISFCMAHAVQTSEKEVESLMGKARWKQLD